MSFILINGQADLRKLDVSGLSIPEDVLFQLAKSESDTENKIAQCLSALSEVNTDIKSFAKATHNTLTTTRRLTLASNALYRFRNVGIVCEEADKDLSLQIRTKYPSRGTLSELHEAQILRMERWLNPHQIKLSITPADEREQEKKISSRAGLKFLICTWCSTAGNCWEQFSELSISWWCTIITPKCCLQVITDTVQCY
ncbi:hypothetical protein IM880_05985 [Pectobacterium polaris]|uniref:Uncharacterized protein n=1 Tax=Pectobacterium polaris TaxID=2042057 RepID=A0AAW4NX65_9GAMM|nr:hypothetical protein [Pectobacterium polaris]MBW5891754.1 hypothetical protein [Pectobacterium polaris]